jgi:hypothetical protein
VPGIGKPNGRARTQRGWRPASHHTADGVWSVPIPVPVAAGACSRATETPQGAPWARQGAPCARVGRDLPKDASKVEELARRDVGAQGERGREREVRPIASSSSFRVDASVSRSRRGQP